MYPPALMRTTKKGPHPVRGCGPFFHRVCIGKASPSRHPGRTSARCMWGHETGGMKPDRKRPEALGYLRPSSECKERSRQPGRISPAPHVQLVACQRSSCTQAASVIKDYSYVNPEGNVASIARRGGKNICKPDIKIASQEVPSHPCNIALPVCVGIMSCLHSRAPGR